MGDITGKHHAIPKMLLVVDCSEQLLKWNMVVKDNHKISKLAIEWHHLVDKAVTKLS